MLRSAHKFLRPTVGRQATYLFSAPRTYTRSFADIPNNLNLNFACPHAVVVHGTPCSLLHSWQLYLLHFAVVLTCAGEVKSVQVPAEAGLFEVFPGHVPTVARLAAGKVLAETLTGR